MLVPRPASSSRFSVRRVGDQQQVHAETAIAKGERIMRVAGEDVTRPTRHSIQVGVDLHLESFGKDASDLGSAWRYLNHSCAPNARMQGRDLVALRAIANGEQVTFDYNANEWDMATPFLCACGAAKCRGLIRGYRHLSPELRAEIAEHVSEHIQQLALSMPITRV
jgi:hypothetical protein